MKSKVTTTKTYPIDYCWVKGYAEDYVNQVHQTDRFGYSAEDVRGNVKQGMYAMAHALKEEIEKKIKGSYNGDYVLINDIKSLFEVKGGAA